MEISYRSALIHKVSGATLAVNTTQYADDDLVGEMMTLTGVASGRGGILQALTLQDLDNQKAALEVYVFDANPSGTTFTNNSALDVADADLPKIIACFSVAGTDYISLADNAVGQKRDLAIPYDSTPDGCLYACLRSAAATPTYSASGLSLVFHFLLDPG